MEGTLGDQEEGCQVQLMSAGSCPGSYSAGRSAIYIDKQSERPRLFECTSRHRLCSTLMVVATPGQKVIVHKLPAQYA